MMATCRRCTDTARERSCRVAAAAKSFSGPLPGLECLPRAFAALPAAGAKAAATGGGRQPGTSKG